MNTGLAFWLIMTVGAAVLLGVALAYGLISRRMRRETKRGEGTEEDDHREGNGTSPYGSGTRLSGFEP
jgi:hypothetical protein